MSGLLALCAIAGALLAVGGGWRALTGFEENWETGGGSPYGCLVCALGCIVFLVAVIALIVRAFL